jgi:hypothetical protein
MSIRHDPLAKRVNRVVSGYPAHKRVVFGFRVSSRLRNRVVFTLQKKKQILDGFKPSRNAKKTVWNQFQTVFYGRFKTV